MALTDKINDGFKQLATLLKGKVDKTATIAVANGGTGATTLAAAQTALGIDKVISANTRLTTAKQTFPNVFVDSNGQLQKTQLATWLDHAKMYNGLIPNGSFQMGDATGWHLADSPLLSMNTTDFPFGAFGSLKCTGGDMLWLRLDRAAVNPYMKYRYSAMFKYEKVNTESNFYAGMEMFDVDGHIINNDHAYHYGNTVTTLAQDLKQGDTKVFLTSLNGWNYNAETYQRGFKFYNYVDSRGYLYDPTIMPYSRYTTWNNWDDGWWLREAASFNAADNSINLIKPWDYANPKDPQGVWRAGTKIAQSTNGGNVLYNLKISWMGGQTGVTQWEYKEVEMQGINTTQSDVNEKFRAGTAYIAPLFIFNYGGNSAGDVTKVSNLYFEKI